LRTPIRTSNSSFAHCETPAAWDHCGEGERQDQRLDAAIVGARDLDFKRGSPGLSSPLSLEHNLAATIIRASSRSDSDVLTVSTNRRRRT
jgi:hypothetical protein